MFEQKETYLLSDRIIAKRMQAFLESAFADKKYIIEILDANRIGIFTPFGQLVKLNKTEMRDWAINKTPEEVLAIINKKITNQQEQSMSGKQLQEFTLQLLPYDNLSSEYPGRQTLNLWAAVAIRDVLKPGVVKTTLMSREQLKELHIDETEAYVAAHNNAVYKKVSIKVKNSNIEYDCINDLPESSEYEFIREVPEHMLLVPSMFYELATKLNSDLFIVLTRKYLFCMPANKVSKEVAQDRLDLLNSMYPEDVITTNLYLVKQRPLNLRVLEK